MGTLQGKQPKIIGKVGQTDAELRSMALEPGKVFINVGSVNNQHEIVFSSVDNQIVHSAAILIAKLRIKSTIWHGKTIHIVCDDILHKISGTLASNQKFAHMRNIEETDLLAGCHMLSDNRLVLNRHIPTGKIHHACIQLPMSGGKRCFPESCCGHLGISD
ncbi:MAG: hypothetical protein BWY75_01512 [bacterium ADurb.Bin425]|nr:MAG: hypothetical protein BWY75_01512 [bacterium ADurb.Bin425]